MTSSAAVNEIVVSMEEQVRLYRRLLDLSNAQLAALRIPDVQAVHAILQEIEVAMLDRSRVEQRRGAAIERVAVELGIGVEEVTAPLLQELSDEPIAELIASTSAELRGLIGELDDVVAKNRILLEHELAVIDTLVKGVTSAEVPGQKLYGKTGARAERPRLKILDAQV